MTIINLYSYSFKNRIIAYELEIVTNGFINNFHLILSETYPFLHSSKFRTELPKKLEWTNEN